MPLLNLTISRLALTSSSHPPAEGGGGEPELLADINFQAGTYTVGGSNVAVGDQFATDVGDGTVWDAGDIIPGSGLRGSGEGGTSIPSVIGTLRTAIIGTVGCSLLFEFTSASTDNIISLDIYKTPDFAPDCYLLVGSTNATAENLPGGEGAATTATSIEGNIVEEGAVNKVICTLSKTLVAAQHTTGTIAEEIPGDQSDWTQMNAVAIYRNAYTHLRRIRVYAPLATADYAALMAAGGGEPANALQLGGVSLQLGGETLTLGA